MLFDQRFKRNIIQTGVVQILNIASFVVLLVFVLPRTITKEELGLYVTFRALVNTLFPLYTCGLDIAQARYLGFYAGNRKKQDSITTTVIAIFFGVCLVSTGLILLLRPFLLDRFLDGNTSFLWAIMAALLFTGMYRISYTYFQGHKQMQWANLLQFLIFVAGNAVLAVLVWFRWVTNLDHIIIIVAGLPGIAIIPFGYILMKRLTRSFQFRTVLKYALPRLPHLFFTGMIMSGAVILAKYFYTTELAGDFGIATRFFQLVGTLAYAFNMVMLPGVSELWGKGQREELARSLRSYANLVVWAGTACIFGFFVFGPLAIQWFLPPQYEPGIPILKVMAAAALPYFFYIMFRSTIHGVDERPVQVLIDSVQLMTLLASFFTLRYLIPDRPDMIIAFTMTLTYFSSGIASYQYISSRVGFHGDYLMWAMHAVVIALMLFLNSWNTMIAIAGFTTVELILLNREWKRHRGSV